MAELTSFFDWL